MAATVENNSTQFTHNKLIPPTDYAVPPPPAAAADTTIMVKRPPTMSTPISTPPPPPPPPLTVVALENPDSEKEEGRQHALYMDKLKSTILDHLLLLPPDESPIFDPRDEGTSDGWVRRNPSLIRLTGKHPFNCQPPLNSLMQHGFITPSPLHFVRNHGAVPKATWDSWSVEVSGQYVSRPCRLTMDDLLGTFQSQELPVTLVCAGNRRKEQNMVRQSVGFNWGAAGISTAVWKGVPLRDVLNRCGVVGRRRGLYVCFEGEEDLPGGGGSKYGTSVRLEVAMDPSSDIMLAYMMNGDVLPPDHGFPLRMIIPGFIGGRMVKWLRRILVTGEESQNHYHFKDNRVLPSHVQTAEVAEAQGWWYKPEYIINELNINSAITAPCHDEIMPINSLTTQKPFVVKGYAHSGGGKKVTRVELTLDGGETWMSCDIDHPEKPTKYGKYWCWCFWSVEVEVLDLVGAKEIAVRAWDQSQNTQPEKLIWNLMGMMNNCWFRVKVNVCRPTRGEIGLVFEHPTQPGNNTGGWMARQKHIESTHERQSLKKSSKQYSIFDVRRHASPDSPWIIVHGGVYDCTPFVKDHPGGADSILINAGTDCSEEFDAIHSDKAKAMLETYRIGELITADHTSDTSVSHFATIKERVGAAAPTAASSSNSRSSALIPREKLQCRLVSKTSISHDVRCFRFALPSDEHVLGLPVGKHIFLCANINERLCMRAYTPTSKADEVGHFDLVVKIYNKGAHPKFPKGGLMSQHLDSLPIGSTVDVKGPLGHIEYSGRGNFLVNGKHKSARRLAMIAGGTGITPVYQVMQAVLSDPEDETEIWLVYANRTEDDVLLREELDGWAQEHAHRLKVWYVVTEAKREGWPYSVGMVCEEVLREHIPPWSSGRVLALACGPPPMIQFAVQPNLQKLGYDIDDTLLVF